MKNSSLIVLALLVTLVGGIGVYVYLNREVSPTPSETMMQNESMKTATMSSEMKNDSRYLPFTPEAFSDSANSRRVLFFYANWCPTCQPADASFSEYIKDIPSDVTVLRVNYNDTATDQAEKELAKKYGVTYQHTFVQIDAEGNEVTKWNGGKIEELLHNIR
jgi:thiol-disulfide isomerase/thioredoxin